MATKKVKIGDCAKDVVTGLIGIATSKHEYLNGCVQFTIEPGVDENGNMKEHDHIDEARLMVVKSQVFSYPMEVKKAIERKSPGGGFRHRP